jgi:hypothetical protein
MRGLGLQPEVAAGPAEVLLDGVLTEVKPCGDLVPADASGRERDGAHGGRGRSTAFTSRLRSWILCRVQADALRVVDGSGL